MAPNASARSAMRASFSDNTEAINILEGWGSVTFEKNQLIYFRHIYA